MYKLDLSRGYRLLRLDPLDWPLMCIQHDGQFYLDLCPPFGLRTAAMMMERTTIAVCYIHGLHGFTSKPYIDDLGGAETLCVEASKALATLQAISKLLGLEEAPGKTCEPSTSMIWLDILIDSVRMVMSIPELKLSEISEYCKTHYYRAPFNFTHFTPGDDNAYITGADIRSKEHNNAPSSGGTVDACN